jgi:hypothetical protein
MPHIGVAFESSRVAPRSVPAILEDKQNLDETAEKSSKPARSRGVKRMPKSSDGVLPPQTFAKGHKKETDDPRLTVPAPEKTGASSPFSRRLFARGCPDPALTVAKSESAYSPTIIFGDGDALPDGGRPATASAQA